MGLLEAIIISVIAASTPLLLAAAGELVVERSGVLNLGSEGMMIMGAACGFAGAWLTGSTFIGALFGIAAGCALSLVFATLTLGLAVNQVAAGLALTILGVGLSGLIGAYQTGMQLGVLPGPSGCTVAHAYVMGSGAPPPAVNCNVVTWSLFGLSLAGFNAIFSLLIAGTGAFLLGRKHAA